MIETVWNTTIDVDIIDATIIEHLQTAAIWTDGSTSSAEKTLAMAFNSVVSEQKPNCVQAFHQAQQRLLLHADPSVREGLLYTLEHTNGLLSIEELAVILRDNWNVYDYPISKSRRDFRKFQYEVFLEILGKHTTKQDPISLQFLQDALAKGYKVQSILARIDPEWLTTNGAQYVGQDKWFGGILLQLPTDQFRLQLIENMAPWTNSEEVLSLRFWSVLRGDISALQNKIRALTPPTRSTSPTENLARFIRNQLDTTIPLGQNTNTEISSDPIAQKFLESFQSNKTNQSLDPENFDEWYKTNKPKEYQQWTSMISNLSTNLDSVSEEQAQAHLQTLIQNTIELSKSTEQAPEILQDLQTWLENLMHQLQNMDIDSVAEELQRNFGEIIEEKPIVDTERIKREIAEEMKINVALHVPSPRPFHLGNPNKPKS